MLHHPGAWFLFFLLVDAVCAVTLMAIAEARGQSKLFGFWGLLGFAGLIAGLLIMLALPTRTTPPSGPVQTSG